MKVNLGNSKFYLIQNLWVLSCNYFYFINISVIQSFLPLRKIVFFKCKNTIFFTCENIILYNTATFICFVCSKNLDFFVNVSEINRILHGCLEI